MVERTKIRLTRGWGGYREGAVIPAIDKRVAEVLVRQNRAEFVVEEPPAEEPPTEKPKRKRKKKQEPETDPKE